MFACDDAIRYAGNEYRVPKRVVEFSASLWAKYRRAPARRAIAVNAASIAAHRLFICAASNMSIIRVQACGCQQQRYAAHAQ